MAKVGGKRKGMKCENCKFFKQGMCFNEHFKNRLGFVPKASDMRALWSFCAPDGVSFISKRSKLNDFYIHYRRKDSRVWNGLQKFRCRETFEAIEMCREIFIENWDFACQKKGEGKKEIRNYVFEEYIA